MTYDEVVRGLRDSTYELQNEGRLVRAGLKTEQDTASIIERYAWLYSDEALGVVCEPAGEAQKRVRSAILQGIIERRTAAQQNRLTTFYAEASAPVHDEQVPFYTAQAQERSLRGRFGERWWATAEAGEWLRQQWRRGWEPEAEDTVAEMGGKPWSGDALLERLEHRLPIAVR
jgi:hypothetical protein